MTEVLNGIRIIKFFAWEPPYIKNLHSLRQQEVRDPVDMVLNVLLVEEGTL